MVEARAAQGGLYGLVGVPPETRVDQAGLYALASIGVPVRAAQGGMYALVAITPQVPVAQAGMYVLAYGSPCTTRLCQIWTITRTDGVVFRFTSKDTDWIYLGEEYKACDSLTPSASESVSEADTAGSMDLSGAVGPDGITKEALYSGLFDGAEVEAWLVPWAGFAVPKLLLMASFGPVEQSETGFKVELLGDGAKLMQTPLISLVTPGCRWITNGGFGGEFCGIDLAPLTVTGTIDSGIGLRAFTDAARVEAAGYFTRGKVTFTSGNNAGISAEIKEHSTGGVFELWPRVPFPILAGTTYSMTPGCTGLHEASGGTNGCEAWNNKRRFGGFKKVPGGDKRSAAANVR
jgi:uncharacterized phage protein (TIGR02218 family)